MTWPAAALLSLSDRSGAVEFAKELDSRGTKLMASGGTARFLEQAGLQITAVERLTGFAELLGGRVKTLHPHVHAPILARRDVASDMESLAERELPPIDLVAVSLYPFEEKAGQLDERGAVEEIDIGGVALLRGAAKNYAGVIVVHDPGHYGEVLAALRAGGPTHEQRRAWAARTFAHTARYDAAIASHLAAHAGASAVPGGEVSSLPAFHFLALERVRALRYGENPHQEAALYARAGQSRAFEAWQEGRELSYNNLLDLEAAVSLVWRFESPACVIVKHTQPCGAAVARDAASAFRAALRSDELSAFGGIVAFNRPLEGAVAHELAGRFVECVAAPEFAAEAREALSGKKNLRALRLASEDVRPPDPMRLALVGRWALIQRDGQASSEAWKIVTRKSPSDAERLALAFAWEIAAAARSNAVAIARASAAPNEGTALVGLGSGQTSRVDAVDVAVMKARRAGHDLAGSVLASDGFFPFPDNIEHAARAGVTAIVQPGGSMRDGEVLSACDRLGISMAFTGRRTFRH